MNYIFDSHAHYDDKAFDSDREELLSGLKAGGVDKVMNISARIDDIEKIHRLTRNYDFMWMSTGIHPTETYALATGECVVPMLTSYSHEDEVTQACADDASEIFQETTSEGAGNEALKDSGEIILDNENSVKKYIENSIKFDKTKAIGEIGLDYHYDDTDKKCQQKWFAVQIELAFKHSLPIIVHSRDAAADTLGMIKEMNARDVGGVIHCFSYELEMAKQYMDMGFYIGIGGVVTFKNGRKLKEIAEYMPMELMLLETDCPYLAPEPHRGKRNDSTMIKYVVDEISRLKNIEPDEVRRITNENACRMYGIDA